MMEWKWDTEHFQTAVLFPVREFMQSHPTWSVGIAGLAISWIVLLWIGLFRQWQQQQQLLASNKEPIMIHRMSPIQFMRYMLARDGPQFLVYLARALGTCSFRLPGYHLRVYVVGDASAARSILEHHKTIKTPYLYEFFQELAMGETFLVRNGKRAHHVRRATAPAFTPIHRQRMTEIIDRLTEEWIATRLEPLYVQAKIPVDIDREMIELTTSILTEVCFDYRLSSTERWTLIRNIQLAMQEFEDSTNIYYILSWTSWIFSGIQHKGHAAAKQVYNLCAKMLESYKTSEHPNHNTVLAMMVQDADYASDEERIRDMVSFLISGFDTVAHTLAWTFLELARCPEEQVFLQAALSKCTTQDEAVFCPALKYVIREVLRLYGPHALGSIRTPGQDVVVSDTKKTIPKGSICFLPYYLIMRNGDIFPYPDSFVPSRWERPTQEQLLAFMPFGAGRRNCQGLPLATAELRHIIARLVGRYTFQVISQGQFDYFVTLKPSKSLLLVSPRESG